MEALIDKVRRAIIDKNLAVASELAGCSDKEIKQIMRQQGVERLPRAYELFLGNFGKEAGKLWIGTAYKCSVLGKLKSDATNLLKLDGDPITLPADAFVFQMQDGIIFYYFHVNHDDPPVYVYSEIEYTHEQVDDRLSDYLMNVW